jgi:hypothetical protein
MLVGNVGPETLDARATVGSMGEHTLHVLAGDHGDWLVAERPIPAEPLSRHRDAGTAVRAATTELERRHAEAGEVLLHDRYNHVRVASRFHRRGGERPAG